MKIKRAGGCVEIKENSNVDGNGPAIRDPFDRWVLPFVRSNGKRNRDSELVYTSIYQYLTLIKETPTQSISIRLETWRVW